MQGSSALDKYELKKAYQAINMLLIDRSNEFRILAQGIGYPINTKDWELIIMNFCLDYIECFHVLSDDDPPDHYHIHKCMTQIRQMTRGKTNMTEVTHLQNIAYLLAEDFKAIYRRIE
jgi:hypothetical protein